MFVAAAGAPLLVRALGRDAGYPLAGAYLAVAGALAVHAPAALRGEEVVASVPWIPSIGVSFALRLDGLAILFAALVLVIGALVMAYTARYLAPGKPAARLYTVLTLFAASMLGVVLADDVIVLFLFWELTSITSFLLIGGDGIEGRSPALRAFLVTGAGGLALLGGLVLMALAAGTFDLSAILADPDAVGGSAFAPAILVLLLLGAFTKSAQFPFHFWLPGAMVAPTPVSTYLHAATMVKAGIYLLFRVSPVYAGNTAWTTIVVVVGLLTALIGAMSALRATDLKALLAGSTISSLGFMTALIGLGTSEAIAAAALFVLAHAAYKACLFMVAGIVEHEAGTRDLRELSGLRGAMPGTFVVATLGALSMAGLPPFVGFVSKEAALDVFLLAPGGTLAVVLVVGAVVALGAITFAYSFRLLLGTFAGPVRAPREVHEAPLGFVVPPAAVALVGIALGLAVPVLDRLVGSAAAAALGVPGEVHLALWHGFNLPLALSAVAIALGAVLVVCREAVEAFGRRLRLPPTGAVAFDRAYDVALTSGKQLGQPFLSSSPARHVAWVLLALGLVGLATVGPAAAPAGELPPSDPREWALAVLLALSIGGMAVVRDRLAAVALLGSGGFLIATLYVLLGAPDLALTQLLIETLTVVLVVLVFRHMPERFPRVALPRRVRAAGMAVVAGTAAAFVTYTMIGRRPESEAARYFLDSAEAETGGTNVVNTILVDFRALDTLGEITVLVAAAAGAYALVRIAGRTPRAGGEPIAEAAEAARGDSS